MLGTCFRAARPWPAGTGTEPPTAAGTHLPPPRSGSAPALGLGSWASLRGGISGSALSRSEQRGQQIDQDTGAEATAASSTLCPHMHVHTGPAVHMPCAALLNTHRHTRATHTGMLGHPVWDAAPTERADLQVSPLSTRARETQERSRQERTRREHVSQQPQEWPGHPVSRRGGSPWPPTGASLPGNSGLPMVGPGADVALTPWDLGPAPHTPQAPLLPTGPPPAPAGLRARPGGSHGGDRPRPRWAA